MNRPIKENFKGHLENNCWVSKHVEYMEELEKYCNELEDWVHENRLRIEKLDRALDKACEFLAYDHFNAPNLSEVEIEERIHWYPEDWRMWLVTGDADE